MKKKLVDEMDDDLLPHYDFANMSIVKRGPGYESKSKRVTIYRVALEPDVAAVFPDEASVNQALRLLIQAREIGKKAA